MSKKELLNTLAEAMFGENKVKNAANFSEFMIKEEMKKFNSYSKTDLQIYLAVNYNVYTF